MRASALLALAGMGLVCAAWWHSSWRQHEVGLARRSASITGAGWWTVDVPPAWPTVALACAGVAALAGAVVLAVAVFVAKAD